MNQRIGRLAVGLATVVGLIAGCSAEQAAIEPETSQSAQTEVTPESAIDISCAKVTGLSYQSQTGSWLMGQVDQLVSVKQHQIDPRNLSVSVPTPDQDPSLFQLVDDQTVHDCWPENTAYLNAHSLIGGHWMMDDLSLTGTGARVGDQILAEMKTTQSTAVVRFRVTAVSVVAKDLTKSSDIWQSQTDRLILMTSYDPCGSRDDVIGPKNLNRQAQIDLSEVEDGCQQFGSRAINELNLVIEAYPASL